MTWVKGAFIERIKERRKKEFLRALKECGNVKAAALKAGIPRKWHYNWLEDPEYKAQFEETIEEAIFRRDGIIADTLDLCEKKIHELVQDGSVDAKTLLDIVGRLNKGVWSTRAELEQTIVHNEPVEIRVVQDENWYGNANLVTAAAAAESDSSAHVASEAQSAGEREAVGQDGAGADGGDAGARP